MRSSRYVLPQDLDTAIKQLSDQELDKLATAVLEERARRRKTPVAEGGHRRQRAEAEAVTLPQGKVNAVLAAFKAGVSPTRIAREFGISKSDVQKTVASHSKRQ